MHHRRAAAVAASLSLVLAALLTAAVGAHSDLVSSEPADGATLTAPPIEISGDFSEPLDATRSVLELRTPGGSVLATGRVPEGGIGTRMAIADLPMLAPGAYEVRWTTVTADDDGVERGTFRFTLVASSPSATPPAEPPPTEPPPTPAPTTPASASGAPTSAPPAAPTSAPPAAPTSPGRPESGSTSANLLVPLAVLAAVLVGGGAWLMRRRA